TAHARCDVRPPPRAVSAIARIETGRAHPSARPLTPDLGDRARRRAGARGRAAAYTDRRLGGGARAGRPRARGGTMVPAARQPGDVRAHLRNRPLVDWLLSLSAHSRLSR